MNKVNIIVKVRVIKLDKYKRSCRKFKYYISISKTFAAFSKKLNAFIWSPSFSRNYSNINKLSMLFKNLYHIFHSYKKCINNSVRRYMHKSQSVYNLIEKHSLINFASYKLFNTCKNLLAYFKSTCRSLNKM